MFSFSRSNVIFLSIKSKLLGVGLIDQTEVILFLLHSFIIYIAKVLYVLFKFLLLTSISLLFLIPFLLQFLKYGLSP